MRVAAIVPAAGIGKRFGGNKPLAALRGMPLVAWVLRALEGSARVHMIVPVVKREDFGACESLYRDLGITKATAPVEGGPERQDSVYNGLRALPSDIDAVLIHDGARPMLTADLIARCIDALAGHDGAVAAVPPKDTIKQAAPDQTVDMTLDRSRLWAIQTPQVFPLKTILAAHEAACGHIATDDAALVERAGGRVKLVMGMYENIKVTTPEDIAVAEALWDYIRRTP